MLSNFKSYSQVPQAIPYQAVARNSSGGLIANATIRIRFTIHDSIATGTIIYQETFSPTTNSLGLFNVNMGTGTVATGTMTAVNWGHNAKFMQVELDPSGGTSFVDMGTMQMMSVPYALHANTADSLSPHGTSPTPGSVLTWSGTGWGPALPASTTYSSGTGINISGTTISAQNTSPLWNSNSLQGSNVSASSPTTGQVLQWSGSTWTPSTISAVSSVAAGTGLSGGTITTSGTISLPNVGTPGTYGSATSVPTITTDAQGRVTSITTSAISAGLTGAGTGNYVPKYSTASGYSTNLTTSEIYDAGNYLGIHTTSPSEHLHVIGRIRQDDPYTTGSCYQMNVSNAAHGLNINHTGNSGTPIEAVIGNTSNNSTLAVLQTSGTGRGLELDNTNTSNSNNLMYLSNVGTGNLMYMYNSGNGNPIFIDNYGTGRFINASNGAYLSNGGVWTNASYKKLKENFQNVNKLKILEGIAELEITSWNYIREGKDVKHIGPMSEDFYQVFHVGNDDKSISTIDPAGIALVGVQELYKMVIELQKENSDLKKKLESIHGK